MEKCFKCKGNGKLKLWNGSIHDPKDPEIEICPICKGEGYLNYIDNIQ